MREQLHSNLVVGQQGKPWVSHMLVPPTPHGSAWPSRCLKILTKALPMLANSILLCYTTSTWKWALMSTSHSCNLLQRIHIFVDFFQVYETLRYKWAKLQLQHSKMAKWDANCIPICMYNNKEILFFYMFTSLLKIEVFNQQKIDQSHPKLR